MIRDVDKGYRKAVATVLGLGIPKKISVGINEEQGAMPHDDKSGLSLLDVAIINEFGLGNCPERSFIRAWFDLNEDRAAKMVKAILESVIAGRRTEEQALQLLAMKFVSEIQARIASGIAPENAPSTIAKKGSSTPLIDTGLLRSSISFKVG